MIEVVFLGVGEAFDESQPNTSILLKAHQGASRVNLLLDCGATAPPQFWKTQLPADSLGAVWISHFHGDHFFGLPALLFRFVQEGRSAPLSILGQKGLESAIMACIDLAYPGVYGKIPYPIVFHEVEPGLQVKFQNLSLRFAENDHSRRDLAIRIDVDRGSVFYSGDGRPTKETVNLARGCGLIIHEAFHKDKDTPNHGTVTGAIDMAKACKARDLALVHLDRGARPQILSEIREIRKAAAPVKVLIPEPGDSITIGSTPEPIGPVRAYRLSDNAFGKDRGSHPE